MTTTTPLLSSLVPPHQYDAFLTHLYTQNYEGFDEHSVKKSYIVDAAKAAGIRPAFLYKSIFQEENRSSWGYYSMVGELAARSIQPNNNDIDNDTIDDDSSLTNDEDDVTTKAVSLPKQQQQQQTKNVKTPSVSYVNPFPAEVPEKDPEFIPWGNATDIKKIIASGEFFPIYLSGMSGTGKSYMVKNLCAALKRKYIRVQCSSESDESDLIGSFQLVNEGGTTVTRWQDSGVITAMKEGCVLLLDELDRINPTVGGMALQGILEGKPVLIKKTGEMVYPKPGFTIIATGNTKGRGSEDGKYVAAQILDDSTLERFVIDIEQEYPNEKILKKILEKYVDVKLPLEFKESAKVFADELVAWAGVIKTAYENDAIDELVSIRRLVHVLQTYSIFKNELKSIRLAVNRYDPLVRDAFIDLYRKVSKLDHSANGNTDDNDDNEEEEVEVI